MKSGWLALALAAAGCASPPEDAARESHLGIHLGGRGFGEDWDPVEHQGTIGFEFVHEPTGSVVGIEAALFASERNEDDFFVPPVATVDVRGRSTELSFGVHKEIPVDYGGVHPYFGGGLSLLHAELRGAEGGVEREEDGDSPGLYVHAGIEFDASEALFIGLDLRLRGGDELDLLGYDRPTSYGQVTFVLGVRF